MRERLGQENSNPINGATASLAGNDVRHSAIGRESIAPEGRDRRQSHPSIQWISA
jgi:hypothetical protein